MKSLVLNHLISNNWLFSRPWLYWTSECFSANLTVVRLKVSTLRKFGRWDPGPSISLKPTLQCWQQYNTVFESAGRGRVGSRGRQPDHPWRVLAAPWVWQIRPRLVPQRASFKENRRTKSHCGPTLPLTQSWLLIWLIVSVHQQLKYFYYNSNPRHSCRSGPGGSSLPRAGLI